MFGNGGIPEFFHHLCDHFSGALIVVYDENGFRLIRGKGVFFTRGSETSIFTSQGFKLLKMCSRGCMNDDRLISVCGLDFPHSKTVPFESLPCLGRTQIDVQFIGFGVRHADNQNNYSIRRIRDGAN